MANLTISGLTCVKTTAEAKDEPYLTVRVLDYAHPELRPWNEEIDVREIGTVWGPQQMDDGEARRIEGVSIDFNHIIVVELHEEDRIGRDDYIDQFRYTSGELRPESRRIYPGQGEMRYGMSGHRARYELIYDLRDWSYAEGVALDRFDLILHSLRCNDAQERRDEPYLVVNGNIVWRATNVKSGETRSMRDLEIPFGTNAQIDLWESDGSKSDRIGSFKVDFEDIRELEHGQSSEQTQHGFWRDRGIVGDASYTLRYSVRRANR